ncbi:MAG: sigma-70 family RNA polymerase sigma factor [Verrucomicrobiales bacterium]|nr:sigma-70 family RNA polymerase sigma factor [Verrucomicrobiales bacterium]
MNLFPGHGNLWVVVTAAPPASIDDPQALLDRARAGCAESFCRVGRIHQVRLFRQALILSGEVREAEELAAETLVEAWRSLSRFDGSCRFTTWLYAILLHRFQKAARRPKSRPIPFSELDQAGASLAMESMEPVPDPDPRPDTALVRRERDAELWGAVAELPLKHQQVLLLRFFEDASLAEIASVLELSLGTVKSRLHHALGKLRAHPTVVNLLREVRDE